MDTSMTSSLPAWWNDRYDSAWDRVKGALLRDLEQTRHDLGFARCRDLQQDALDTILQALGWEPARWRAAEAPGVHLSLGAWTAYLASDLRREGERPEGQGPIGRARVPALCLV